MKKLSLTLLTCLIFLSPSMVMGETFRDLVEREGLYYKKFTDVPFNGKVTGKEQGSFKNGKREGIFVYYRDSGQIVWKGNYKNGKAEGTWVSYHKNGQLQIKRNRKKGKLEGAWVSYHKNGQLHKKGNYKNDKYEGAFVRYWNNGQLRSKGNWKNNEKEGAYVSYNKDGTVWKTFAGTFKDGMKISD